MRDLMLIGLGGSFGAMLRFSLSHWANTNNRIVDLPVGTLLVNVLGCLAIGMLVQIGKVLGLSEAPFRSFLVIGFLGAFTTFSTFSMETVDLFMAGRPLAAGMNVILNAALSVGGVLVGMGLVNVAVMIKAGQS